MQQAEVRPRGLSGDRRWMVVDENGSFLQQRVEPKMALVAAEIQPDQSLVVTAPDMPELLVPVPTGEVRRSVTVWRDTLSAAATGPDVSVWFSEYLGRESHLTYMDPQAERPVAAEYGQAGDVVSFADAVPLLLATTTSLDDFNRRLAEPVAMSRFRPNVTIDGDAAWEEGQWRSIRIGDVQFDITHPCARCVVTTIDQRTGIKDPGGEPLKTLATFRRDSDGVYFGQNMIPRTGGVIRVGDTVEVVE